MFRYSYDALVYANEPVADSIKRVARYGASGPCRPAGGRW